MATDNINFMKLVIVHGQKKHNIELQLPAEETGSCLSVHHLADKIESVTEIPPRNQKLIYKGKSLTDLESSLSGEGLKNGCKIMLIGKKPNPDEDVNYAHITSIEQGLMKHEQTVSNITCEIDGLLGGYLEDEREAKLKSISKDISVTAEQFMKLLEELDSMELGQSAAEVKMKRKAIVDKIQSLLKQCDTLSQGVKDMRASLTS